MACGPGDPPRRVASDLPRLPGVNDLGSSVKSVGAVALATVVGELVVLPVMPSLVAFSNSHLNWFEAGQMA